MRIIAGNSRGCKLIAPEGLDTRPTLDRVREAVFNMIFDRVQDAVALDLFAGSGAMGLESLSRGATRCDFVDISDEACGCIRHNIAKTRLDGCNVYKMDFKSFLNGCNTPYDLIFLDPPYEAGYYKESLDIIRDKNLLSEDGMLIVECDRDYTLYYSGFELYRQRVYGKANIYILKNL